MIVNEIKLIRLIFKERRSEGAHTRTNLMGTQEFDFDTKLMQRQNWIKTPMINQIRILLVEWYPIYWIDNFYKQPS